MYHKNGVGSCAMDATVSGQVVVVLKKTIITVRSHKFQGTPLPAK